MGIHFCACGRETKDKDIWSRFEAAPSNAGSEGMDESYITTKQAHNRVQKTFP